MRISFKLILLAFAVTTATSLLHADSLKEIAAKHNRGFYLNLIDNLPIESQEKKRLLRDADIEEAEYEEINEE